MPIAQINVVENRGLGDAAKPSAFIHERKRSTSALVPIGAKLLHHPIGMRHLVAFLICQ